MKLPNIKSIILRFTLLLALAVNASAVATPRLMQGPMIAKLDENSATIWARVAGEHAFSIEYSKRANFENSEVTRAISPDASNDYCVQAKIENLEAGAYYHYRVLLDGQPLDNPGESDGYPFLTAPAEHHQAKFSMAFGSGAQVDADGLQAIWLQVQNARPHAFFWLGQNESFSGLESQFQAEQYRKQRNVPFLQPILRSIPQFSTWDSPENAPSKQAAQKSLDVFKRYWPNPAYGTDKAPGTYFKHSYGKVDFFFLDTYTYRRDGKTLLGKAQTRWLTKQLSESEGVFKIILNGKSWTRQNGEQSESWLAYEDERNAIFDHIQANEIEGVVLVSATDEQAEIKAIPFSEKGGYDLYELASSPLAQTPSPEYAEPTQDAINIQDPYMDAMNFGLLSFDMTLEDPTISYDVINVFGESVFPAFQLKASELSNGVVSWKTKIDAESLAYIENSSTQAF
ncbi:alkaline phosphatase D family protein [Puniceicoccaceae bacterium K14]|nr:alkaline phosphatase D family protein [Puniceicoccaceae bacterium K14]